MGFNSGFKGLRQYKSDSPTYMRSVQRTLLDRRDVSIVWNM